jgi:hypothetical protein
MSVKKHFSSFRIYYLQERHLDFIRAHCNGKGPMPSHETFEFKGNEYNFGANDASGFPVKYRIPLPKYHHRNFTFYIR